MDANQEERKPIPNFQNITRIEQKQGAIFLADARIFRPQSQNTLVRIKKRPKI